MKLLSRAAAICAATVLCAVTLAGPGSAQQDATDDPSADAIADALNTINELESLDTETPSVVDAPSVTDDVPVVDPLAPDVPLDGELLDPALAGALPTEAAAAPDFLALTEVIHAELERIFPVSDVVWDPQIMEGFDLENAEPDVLLPLNDATCAVEFDTSGEFAPGVSDSPYAVRMCAPLAEPEEMLQWLQGVPTFDEATATTWVGYVERDGAIYTSLVGL